MENIKSLSKGNINAQVGQMYPFSPKNSQPLKQSINGKNLTEVMNIKNALKNKNEFNPTFNANLFLPEIKNGNLINNSGNYYFNTEPEYHVNGQDSLTPSNLVFNKRLSAFKSKYPQTPLNNHQRISFSNINSSNNVNNNFTNFTSNLSANNNYYSNYAHTEVVNTEVTLNDSFYEKMYKNFKKENKKLSKRKVGMNMNNELNILNNDLNNINNVASNNVIPKNEIPKPNLISVTNSNFNKSPKLKRRSSAKKNQLDEESRKNSIDKLKVNKAKGRSRGVSACVPDESEGENYNKLLSSPLQKLKSPEKYLSMASKPLEKKDKLNEANRKESEVIDRIEREILPTTTHLISMATPKKHRGIFSCLPFLCK